MGRGMLTPISKRTYRLIQCGPAHFMISVPSDWVFALNMKKGDKLDCFVLSNGQLLFQKSEQGATRGLEQPRRRPRR